MNPMFFGHNQALGGASAFSDNFTRADGDLPGANWNEVDGDIVISANRLIFVDGGYENHCLMFTSPVLGLTQYQKVKFLMSTTSEAVIGLIFRNVADAGNAYVITFNNDDTVSWLRFSSLVGWAGEQLIASATLDGGIGNDLIVGVTVEGLGNNTTIRIWSNPTGLPLAANNWNGDTTPTLSFTQNPPSPSDAGYRLGIFAETENDYGGGIDDWFGGSL
jgi:hypothetical protein